MNQNLTEIAYILDRSGSMASMVEPAIAGFNSFLDDQLDAPGDARLTLVLFDNEFLLHANQTPLQKVTKLDTTTYIPRGGTALLDAIGRTIDKLGKKLAKTPEDERPSNVIVAIYTDGYENASTQYSVTQIQQMIKHQKEVYGWQFLFLAANEDALKTAHSYGVDINCAAQVHLNEAGLKSSFKSVSRRINAIRASRSTDACSEQTLKDLHADMSSLVKEEQDHFDK